MSLFANITMVKSTTITVQYILAGVEPALTFTLKWIGLPGVTTTTKKTDF